MHVILLSPAVGPCCIHWGKVLVGVDVPPTFGAGLANLGQTKGTDFTRRNCIAAAFAVSLVSSSFKGKIFLKAVGDGFVALH